MYDTEWPILCWCADKKLLTHLLTNALQVVVITARVSNAAGRSTLYASYFL